jgi:hypothetical protein
MTENHIRTPDHPKDGQQSSLPIDLETQYNPLGSSQLDRGGLPQSPQDPTPPNAKCLTPDTASQDSAEKSALEDDATLEICRELTQRNVDISFHDTVPNLSHGREVVEYHDTLNPVTILSRALGNHGPRKLVRLILRDSQPGTTDAHDFYGLDPVDLEFLQKKGAFSLPSTSVW